MNVLNVKSSSAPNAVVFGPEERGFVFAVARRIVGPELADDVTQDALVLAFRHRASFRGDSRYRTWLYRIAVTTALGHLRRMRRSREQLAAELPYDLPDPARSAEDELAIAELAALARAAVDRLEPPYRNVLLLRAADRTEPEIAKQVGISVANVKIRTFRARRRLESELADALAA